MKGYSVKKRLAIIAAFLVAILGISATVFFLVNDYQNDKEQQYINEHASTTGTVTDKYINHGRGYWFHVVVEHTSVTPDGEQITFTIDYCLPEENLTDYYQIEVGDQVLAKYTSFTRGGLWQYVSFEKTA